MNPVWLSVGLSILLEFCIVSVYGQDSVCVTGGMGSLHPHPTNCSRYYKCNNMGKTEDHTCEGGTVWSTEKQYCDYSYNVACDKGLRREFEKCSGGKWRCGSGECVLRETQCDGITHCQDGSDEGDDQCGQSSCAAHLFQCVSVPQCVSSVKVCNGVTDCQDGSDERIPPCPGLPSQSPPSPPLAGVHPSHHPHPQTSHRSPASVAKVTSLCVHLCLLSILFLH